MTLVFAVLQEDKRNRYRIIDLEFAVWPRNNHIFHELSPLRQGKPSIWIIHWPRNQGTRFICLPSLQWSRKGQQTRHIRNILSEEEEEKWHRPCCCNSPFYLLPRGGFYSLYDQQISIRKKMEKQKDGQKEGAGWRSGSAEQEQIFLVWLNKFRM